MADMTVRELLEIKAPNYTPPPNYRGTMNELGLPPFTIRQVNLMLHDSQIKLGKAIKVAPLMHVKFNTTGRQDVAAFAEKMMRVAWDLVVPKAVSALWYKVFCGQPIYKRNDSSGLMELSGLNDYFPSDIDFLEVDRQLVGIRIKTRTTAKSNSASPGSEDLYGMKSFIYIHKQQFGSRDGESELEGAYAPWLEKSGPDGGMAIRRLWYYKNSFDSGILFHPPGSYQWNKADGSVQEVPYRDVARQALERSAAGGVWVLPNVYDQEGHRLWEYTPPKMNGDGAALINYVEQLNTEMLRGMGIPDDIISQTSGTGSYAGRSIPFQAFLTSQTGTIRALFEAIRKQIVLPLCWWNFQSLDVEFTDIECDRDKLLPPDQPEQPPAGMGMPGAADGQPMDPNAVDPQQAAMAAAAMQQGQPQATAPQQAA